MKTFAFVEKLLLDERSRLVKERDIYGQKKTPKGWCPSFTYELRKPYADKAQAHIDEIDRALTLLK